MPSFMGVKYKGKDEIAARRCVKVRVVNMLWDLAVEDPISAIDDQGLNYAAQVVVPEFVSTLTEESKPVLTTGKGCGQCPNEIRLKGDFKGLTLWDYLVWGGSSGTNRPACFASYVHGGYLWASQVMNSNKHAFPKQTVRDMRARLKVAYDEKRSAKMLKFNAVKCPFCSAAMEACTCD